MAPFDNILDELASLLAGKPFESKMHRNGFVELSFRVALARGHQEEHRKLRDPVSERLKELARGRIDPLFVLYEKHQRASPRQLPKPVRKHLANRGLLFGRGKPGRFVFRFNRQKPCENRIRNR
ncbi:hypothetical protein D3C87_1855710 [compost metagenome]